jgi:hypothetical protein
MSYFSQLDLYNGNMFMQDHELISFAEQYEVNGINYIGDTQYLESVVGRHALSQDITALLGGVLIDNTVIICR